MSEERKVGYCERAYEILTRRGLSDMDLDEMTRLIEQSLGSENGYGVENPAKETTRSVRIRNTLYKQTGEKGGWRKALTRRRGPMDRWRICLIGDGTASHGDQSIQPASVKLSHALENRLQVALGAGFDLEKVIAAGLGHLAKKIEHELKKKHVRELKAIRSKKK